MTTTEYIARDAEAREKLAAAQALLNCSPDYLGRIGISEQAIAQARALVQAGNGERKCALEGCSQTAPIGSFCQPHYSQWSQG